MWGSGSQPKSTHYNGLFFFSLWKIEKDSVNAAWEETQVLIVTKTELPNSMKLVFLYLLKVCHQMLVCPSNFIKESLHELNVNNENRLHLSLK